MTRKPQPLLFAVMLAYAAMTTGPVQCRADGGRVVHIERLDDVTITVFAAPSPLTAGPVDVSFLVQDAESSQAIPNASISILYQKETAPEHAGESPSVAAAASRELATNKLLQAAIVDLPSGGEWRITTTVTIDDRKAEFDFTLSFTEATSQSEWRKAVALPLLGIALFAIHRQLKRARKRPQPTSFPLDAASA